MTTIRAADADARRIGFTIRRNRDTGMVEMKRFGMAYCWTKPATYADVEAALRHARQQHEEASDAAARRQAEKAR